MMSSISTYKALYPVAVSCLCLKTDMTYAMQRITKFKSRPKPTLRLLTITFQTITQLTCTGHCQSFVSRAGSKKKAARLQSLCNHRPEHGYFRLELVQKLPKNWAGV